MTAIKEPTADHDGRNNWFNDPITGPNKILTPRFMNAILHNFALTHFKNWHHICSTCSEFSLQQKHTKSACAHRPAHNPSHN